MSLKDQTITAASTLVYEETQECTFYLEHKDLRRVVASVGGASTDNINGKTTIVVLGETSKDRNKKGENKWVGSGKQKLLVSGCCGGRITPTEVALT